MAGTKRRSTRQAAVRKRSMYVDPDTDDDFVAGSDGDAEGDFQLDEPEEPIAPPPKKRKTVMRHKPQTRSRAKNSHATNPIGASFKIGKPRRPNSKALPEEKKEFAGVSDNRIPKWTSLPVSILRDIFVYASQPIDGYADDAASANVSWLLRAARTCRAFALPALEAYYRSPALYTSLHPHHFLDLLHMPNDKRYIDYNVKVQTLAIDVRILAYVAYSKPSFDLATLVKQLPQLQNMEIMHPRYLPPYRPLNIQRWTFPAGDVFDAMDARQIRLKSWRWSRGMIPKNAFVDLYGAMTAAHGRRVFSRLKRLVVCGFNYKDSSEPTADKDAVLSDGTIAAPPGLATAIDKLPDLQDLTFISCDIIMDKFLLRLPTNLQRLELSNCLEITSDMMCAFFKTSASQLRELVLNHNAALSLAFLTELKMSCPRLEVLKVDMHYYSEKFTVNDAVALYDELLSENDIPTWPPTLRHLSFIHAQKWEPEAAQNLFRSLLDSAPELLNLRQLVLQTHINIPWRDRVGFRDQWIERLRRVFLQRTQSPIKYLGSLRQYRLWKQSQDKMPISSSSIDELGHDYSEDDIPFVRKVSHVAISPYKSYGDTEVYSDTDAHSNSAKREPRRSKRVADSQIVHASKSTTEAEESESEDEEDQPDWRKQPEKFIQGMCDLVDIRIDNQRPRENQFTEGDFLDSEVSGDEDWHEGADEADDSYAW